MIRIIETNEEGSPILVKISTTIHGVPVAAEIVRAGQQEANTSDAVIARITVTIGLNEQKRLPKPIRYGYRVCLLGSPMISTWGDNWATENGAVSKHGYASAATWDEAFALAEKELQPLFEAAAKREQALVDAEKT